MSGQHDLTHKMIRYLDLHLVFPLLEFLEINEVKARDSVEPDWIWERGDTTNQPRERGDRHQQVSRRCPLFLTARWRFPRFPSCVY